MHKILFSAAAILVGVASVQAQCTTWVSPSPTTGYNFLGEVPCNGESIEITGLDVLQSEAYELAGVLSGGNYVWSQCNGAFGSWTPEYTVIAPSGAVDAFGPGTGCTITWTASESGTYLLVINEAGQCGVLGEGFNGFPSITTISGGLACTPPPVVLPGAESFEAAGLPECWLAVDADGDTNNWEVSDQFGGFDGTFSAHSLSFNGTPLNPDNWLITPQVAVGADDSLYFAVSAPDFGFFLENYSVLVSTTGNNAPADFTTVLFNEVLPGNSWFARSIDMSAYASQNVYLAFRHHDVTNQSILQIDIVHLPGTNLCVPSSTSDLAILESLNLFPNPSNGVFHVQNTGRSDNFLVQVYDMNGRIVRNDRVELNSGSQIQIDLSGEAKGVYTARFIGASLSGSIRMIVQ